MDSDTGGRNFVNFIGMSELRIADPSSRREVGGLYESKIEGVDESRI